MSINYLTLTLPLTLLWASCSSSSIDLGSIGALPHQAAPVLPQVSTAKLKGDEVSSIILKASDSKDKLGVSIEALSSVVDSGGTPGFSAIYDQLVLDYNNLADDLTSAQLSMSELTKINLSLSQLAEEKDLEALKLRENSESIIKSNSALYQRVKDKDIKIDKLEDSLRVYKTVRNFIVGCLFVSLIYSVLRFKIAG